MISGLKEELRGSVTASLWTERQSYKSILECIVNAERKECKNQKICLNRMTQQAITEMVPGLCRS